MCCPWWRFAARLISSLVGCKFELHNRAHLCTHTCGQSVLLLAAVVVVAWPEAAHESVNLACICVCFGCLISDPSGARGRVRFHKGFEAFCHPQRSSNHIWTRQQHPLDLMGDACVCVCCSLQLSQCALVLLPATRRSSIEVGAESN